MFITIPYLLGLAKAGKRIVMKKKIQKILLILSKKKMSSEYRLNEDSKAGDGSSKYIIHFFSGHHFNFRYS